MRYEFFIRYKKQDLFGIGTMAAGGMQLGASIAQIVSNEKMQQRQFEFDNQQNKLAYQRNQEMLDKQYEQNLAQWNRENAYNSPIAQQARFAEAGLNKNLVYGQSNTSASSPTMGFSPAKPSSARVPGIDLGTFVNAIGALGEGVDKLLKAQRDSKLMDINVDMQKELLNQLRLKGSIMADPKFGLRNATETLANLNEEKLKSLQFSNSLNEMKRELFNLDAAKRQEAFNRYMNEYVPTTEEQKQKYHHMSAGTKILNGIYNDLKSRFPSLPDGQIMNGVLELLGDAFTGLF